MFNQSMNPSGDQPFFRNDNSTLPFEDNISTMPYNPDDNDGDDSPTVPMGMPDTLPMSNAFSGSNDDDATRPMNSFNPAAPSGVPAAAQRKAPVPVIGWMVVLSGPGRGNSMPLGYGRNSIGRGEENEVCLPFGDLEISKKDHAFIAYDPRSRKCYAQFGNSRNLVYLNGAPLLSLAEMPARSLLRLGKTELMYVPFCTDELDWKDIPENVD